MKLTPINNPVSLRLDTTVGTRIFAGTTMIHGDTGWRHIHELTGQNFTLWGTTSEIPTQPSIGTFLTMKREGNTITLDGRVAASSVINGLSRNSSTLLTDSIPGAFRPHRNYILAGQFWCYTTGERGVVRVYDGKTELQGGTGIWKTGELVIIHASWETAALWPTTLPGLPG